MRKYWQIYKLQLQSTFMYRGSVVIHRLGTVIMLVTLISVWLASKSNGSIGGYSQEQLVTYYVIGSFINSLVFWWCSTTVTNEIKNGELGPKILLKPLSYYWEKFFEEFAWHTISPLIGLTFTLLVALFFNAHIFIVTSLDTWILMFITMCLASILFFSISLCIGLLSFWFTETASIAVTVWLSSFLLGGQSIPITFFPVAVREIVKLLPFRYIYSFPIEIYFKQINQQELLVGFINQIFWIVVFISIYKFLWHFGVKRYSSFGN